MKVEIEITESDVLEGIKENVIKAIVEKNKAYTSNIYINDRVNEFWKRCIDNMIMEFLEKSDDIREKISTAIEMKLKKQIEKAIKLAGKD